MEKLLPMTKELYHDMVDYTGDLYSQPHGIIRKRNLKLDAVKFLQDYILFVMSSKVVSNMTKIYIKSSSGSITAAIRSHNQGVNEAEQINVKSAQSSIDYSRKRLLTFFPDDMLVNIIYSTNTNIIDYRHRLNIAKMKFNKEESLSDMVLLKLSKSSFCTYVSDEEFNEFVSILAHYRRNLAKEVEDKINDDAVGYLNYLQTSIVLTDIDEKRLRQLRDLLC